MTFAATDLRTLESAIRDGILSITPSLESGRPWNHDPRSSPSAPSRVLRQFFLGWGSPEQVIGGATGNLDYELEVPLVIRTHYWAAEPDHVGELAAHDHFDINRHFIDRLETIVGLTNWVSTGWRPEDEEARTYEHTFDVAYMRR
jgi:hypothetical protein